MIFSFGPDPLMDPLGFCALWLMLIAFAMFATSKTPYM